MDNDTKFHVFCENCNFYLGGYLDVVELNKPLSCPYCASFHFTNPAKPRLVQGAATAVAKKALPTMRRHQKPVSNSSRMHPKRINGT